MWRPALFSEGIVTKLNTTSRIVNESDAQQGRPQRVARVPAGMKGAGYEQEVCTPHYIANVVRAVLGGAPDLDPFGSPRSVVGAERQYLLERGEDGTSLPWWGSVYTNPPFESPTLGVAIERAAQHFGEVVLLAPLRPHRRYWAPAWTAQAVCYLEPVMFLEHEHTFPLPCVLLYWGRNAAAFAWNARALGVVQHLTPYESRRRMVDKMTANVFEEYRKRQAAAVVDVIRAHPEMSIGQLVEALGIDDNTPEWDTLMSTPVRELFAGEFAGDVIITPSAPGSPDADPRSTSPSKSRNGANGHAKKAPKRRRKANQTQSAKTADATKALDAYFAGKKKGDVVKTAELMALTGLGRPATIKRLGSYPVRRVGAGRGAYFEVTR